MAEKKPIDPTKEPGFQKVIRHFVTTPHKAHAPLGALKAKEPKKEESKILKQGAPSGSDPKKKPRR